MWYVVLSICFALNTGIHIFSYCNITLKYQNISVTVSAEEAPQHLNTIAVKRVENYLDSLTKAGKI